MIAKIAWRNVWRSRTRSLVVIVAIMVGIWAGVFMTALATGMMEARTQDMVGNFLTHIQIHHPEFLLDKKMKYSLDNLEELENTLQQEDSVINFARRVVINEGMLASTKGNRAVRIIGIDPEKERQITTMYERVVDGNYFEDYKGRPVYLSKKIADKYEYEIGSKVILQFQDESGDIYPVKYKVCGIFSTVNGPHDELTVYVPYQTIFDQIGQEVYQQIALVTPDKKAAKQLAIDLQKRLPDYDVAYFGKISPDLGYSDDMMDTIGRKGRQR